MAGRSGVAHRLGRGRTIAKDPYPAPVHGDTLDATTVRPRIVQLGRIGVRVGAYACSNREHPFVPDGHTGTSCMLCFGWCHDPRHWAQPAVTVRTVS